MSTPNEWQIPFLCPCENSLKPCAPSITFRHVASLAFLQDPSIFGMWFLLAVYTHAAYDAPKKVSVEAQVNTDSYPPYATVPEISSSQRKKHPCLYMPTDSITHLKLVFAIYFSRSDFPLCYIAARKSTILSSLSIVHAFFASHICQAIKKRLDYGCDAYLPAPLPLCLSGCDGESSRGRRPPGD